MIQSSETGDVLLLDCGCKVAENESVGVGRVGNYHTFDITVCRFEGVRLLQKDHLVEMKQILSFHSLLTRLPTNKHDNVGTLEHLFSLVSHFYLYSHLSTSLSKGKLQS